MSNERSNNGLKNGTFGRPAGVTTATTGVRTAFLRGAVTALLLLLPVTSHSGEQKSPMRMVKPRELVRTVVAKYTIFQVDQEVGTESVTRTDFDDNSVEFHAKIEMNFTQGSDIYLETNLTVDEGTYFPMSYRSEKKVKQGTAEFDDVTDIDWFANVAVICKRGHAREDTSRITLPTGAAVLDVTAAHHLYPLLFWYDKDLGGVQSFNVFDPNSKRVSSATLRLQTDEKIEVAGEMVTSTRFEFVRDKTTFKIYVDAEGRILKVDQGYMVYELSEKSESGPNGE
jgi:hypothetical protein